MKKILCLIAGACLGWSAQAPADAALLKPGKAHFTVNIMNTELEVYSYRPACHIKSILFVLHGNARDADTYRDDAIFLGDQLCALVVAPEFDKNRFPASVYQRGGAGQTGEYVLELIKWVQQQEQQPLPYSLIGHSAGGQFLSRFAAYTPNQAERIVIANPSTYVLANFDVDKPYGFRGAYGPKTVEAEMRRYLQSPVTIFLGEEDTHKKHLVENEQAMDQGENRYERGIYAYQTAQALAHAKGWAFNWRLVQKSGTGHDAPEMFASQEAIQALAP